MRHPLTPSQTIGPFFHPALVGEAERGARANVPIATDGGICIQGRVLDGRGDPVADALLEAWSPVGPGLEALSVSGAGGFARAATREDGTFALCSRWPGPPPEVDASAWAPHLLVHLFARGILTMLRTRIYFEGEAANARDPVLAAVPEKRRATLVARRTDPGRYALDLVLQGASETVFFDV